MLILTTELPARLTVNRTTICFRCVCLNFCNTLRILNVCASGHVGRPPLQPLLPLGPTSRVCARARLFINSAIVFWLMCVASKGSGAGGGPYSDPHRWVSAPEWIPVQCAQIREEGIRCFLIKPKPRWGRNIYRAVMKRGDIYINIKWEIEQDKYLKGICTQIRHKKLCNYYYLFIYYYKWSSK